MNWKRRVSRNLFLALLCGVAVNAIYFGLLYTTNLHGFAAKALGPAIHLVYFHLDPTCNIHARCDVDAFAVNILLYTFCIFVALMGIDLVSSPIKTYTAKC
jgi:hypothetical protein